MDLKFSKVTRKGPITIVTLSRPEVYNALHIDAHFELNKIFDDFSADPEQWVAIVTGAGDKAFCAGQRSEMAGRRRQARLGHRRIRRADVALRLRQADHRRRQWRGDGRRLRDCTGLRPHHCL